MWHSLPSVLNILRILHFDIFPFFINLSLKTPENMITIRILTYGIEESKPFDLISNLSTSFIYIGALVKNKIVPQEEVKCPI